MELSWKLVRVALWLSLSAFLAAGLIGQLEDALGWSDDPRWTFYVGGWALALAGLVGAIAARIVAALRRAPSRLPVALLIVTFIVGVLVLFVQVLTHLGPLGVV